MRNCDLGLLPASNHATSSSRVSIGVMSTWSRAMQGVPTERAATLHGACKGGQLGRAPRHDHTRYQTANARSANNINHESVRGHDAGGEAIDERVLVATQIWLKASPASTEQLEVCRSPRGSSAGGRRHRHRLMRAMVASAFDRLA